MQLPAFKRIAIVNRGEPAMRFLHAVHELRQEHGAELTAIALYTDPDRRSLFVREADEGYCLGPATCVEARTGERKCTYLDYDRLERALRAVRADAVWVGWGFVAEHPGFVELCDRLGIVFIGPTAEVMRKMGDKIASKRLAEQAQVPVSPWSGGPVDTLPQAREHAERLGYPLMVKATAGGGGRGIRAVYRAEDLEEAFQSARSEALKAFGDGTVFLEKRVDGARHVEVQIIADHHGTVWALGVRDCTIQRRNQKVVEEAPSPALDAQLEQSLRDAAVRLARLAGYRNAGTVECLFEPQQRQFYFMEMNTRLQVEHPVTEATTGVDLVKLQLHVASGGRLEGEPPATVGHAIEVRLNAEDPDNQFAPSPGRVQLFHLPTGPGLRIDTGVREGDDVAPEFDSMIAKIIVFGRDRGEALGRLRRALYQSAVVIRGGTSNKAFLLELLSHPDVVASRVDIGWLDRTWTGSQGKLRPHAHVALMQAAIDVCDESFGLENASFFASAARGRPAVSQEVGQKVELRCAGQPYVIVVRRLGEQQYRVSVDGTCHRVIVDREGEFEGWLTCAGRRHRVVSVVDGLRHLIEVDGVPHRVSRDEGGVVRAPSPAVTLAIRCKVGDQVAQGDRLIVLEAMKMEMGVVSPCTGKVREILVLPNQQVGPGTPLVVIEPSVESVGPSEVARVSFPADAGGSSEPRELCHRALSELRRAVLGYDLSDDEIKDIARQRAEVCALLPEDDEEMWRLENEVLQIFADITMLFRRDKEPGVDQPLSAEESLRTYLRALDGAGDGLLPRFVESLEQALRHYGVQGLEPCPALQEALLFMHKAQRRVDAIIPQLLGVLERKLQLSEELTGFATPAFRALLDRLIEATVGRYQTLDDLTSEVQYRYFDRPFFERGREVIYQRVRQAFGSVLASATEEAAAVPMQQLMACPQPLMGLLTQQFATGEVRARQLAVSLMVRRLYRNRDLSQVAVRDVDGYSVATARFEHEGKRCLVVATHARCEDLSEALRVASGVAQQGPVDHAVSVEVLVASDQHPLRPDVGARMVAEALGTVTMPPAVVQVVVAGANPERWRSVHYFTFLAADGGFREHETHRGIHPMLAERLELWRLQNFKTRQLKAADDVYLFHAVARDNPKDERLLAFVEVRDLTAVRDGSGQIVQLPHLERMYTEALAGIRDFQARRSARERLYWNRVVLYLWPEAVLSLRDMGRISRRLGRLSKNLGLEKVVVRIRTRDPKGGEPRDAVIHISNRVGTGMHLRIDQLSDKPIRPLSAYAQKVVRMRRMGLVYAYEIVRMLTPADATEEADFPHGSFTEYDLDERNRLVPVERPMGNNRANVILGTITNYTTKYPEGMTRVIVLGDASREMGALAEPECLRICLAFDLAERLGVPVEWFSVSSGAKIAMDVGTEGLDWVARVLRRIVEFTQAGGEVNVVVPGVNVGGQSYWDAEATMLMHTRGILVMTQQGSMVLTGKRALEYSGAVSAEDNQGIGGYERIMAPNGQAQYVAQDIAQACEILFRHYEYTYTAPGEPFPRRRVTDDPIDRDISTAPHVDNHGTSFKRVGDVFSMVSNPGRKKPFDIRSVMRSVIDADDEPLERWALMRNAESAVVWDAHLGGVPVCLIGIESRPIRRLGFVPGDGPDTWTGGTLFPLSSKKVARGINAASGNRPAVILANLSGFDGSPESMRKLQLEYGAEIGRAVVNFKGPIVFVVISRYHGGAYVVFSRTLNENLEAAALEGSHASVIGGAPAAAVVFPAEVKARTLADPRVKSLQEEIAKATDPERLRLRAQYDQVYRAVFAEKQGEVAEGFDAVHCVQRAQQVGSLQHIVPPTHLRPYLIEAVERGITRTQEQVLSARPRRGNGASGRQSGVHLPARDVLADTDPS